MMVKEATKNVLINSNNVIDVDELSFTIRYDIKQYESPDMTLRRYFSFDNPFFVLDFLHAINALMTNAIRLFAYNGLSENTLFMVMPIAISMQ